jgi:hypothetical protein
MDWVTQGMDWVMRGMDWVASGVAQITDPRWLKGNIGWAALLGLGMLLLVGWLCLFGGRNRH